jgi:hypothetical protein
MSIERDLGKILALPDDDFFRWRADARTFLSEHNDDPELKSLYEASGQEFDVRAGRAWAPGQAGGHGQPLGYWDVTRMDDFQVIAERQRVMATLAALTDQYRELNQEVNRRETLKWMLAR